MIFHYDWEPDLIQRIFIGFEAILEYNFSNLSHETFAKLMNAWTTRTYDFYLEYAWNLWYLYWDKVWEQLFNFISVETLWHWKL